MKIEYPNIDRINGAITRHMRGTFAIKTIGGNVFMTVDETAVVYTADSTDLIGIVEAVWWMIPRIKDPSPNGKWEIGEAEIDFLNACCVDYITEQLDITRPRIEVKIDGKQRFYYGGRSSDNWRENIHLRRGACLGLGEDTQLNAIT